jgi:hypothetical protein
MSQIQITITGSGLTTEQLSRALTDAFSAQANAPAQVERPLLTADELFSTMQQASNPMDAEEVLRSMNGEEPYTQEDVNALVLGIDNRLVFESLEKFKQYATESIIPGDTLVITDVLGQVIAVYNRH